MIRMVAGDYEMFGHLLGLLNEGGFVVQDFAGANEFYVPDDLVIHDEELHAEIARAVRPGTFVPPLAPRPPGGGDGPVPSEPEPQAAPQARASDEPAGQADLPPLPPKAGPGSGRDAWVEAATARRIAVTTDMSRADIIRTVEANPDGR
jgi:hypothetical protein